MHDMGIDEPLVQAPFSQSEVGMCQLAGDGTVMRVNSRFCDIVRMREPDCLGKALTGWVHEQDRPACAGMLASVDGGRQPSASRAIRLDMGPAPDVWVQLTLVCVRDADGRFLHHLGVFKDITSFKMAEAAFLRQHALFSRIMRHSPVGLLHLEPDGGIGISNPEAARILGLPGDGAEGDRNMFSAIRWHVERDSALVEMDRPLRPESFSEQDVYRVLLPDGREHHVLIRASQVEKDEDLLEGAVLVLEDVTGRLQAERECERLQRELDQTALQLVRSNRRIQELLDEINRGESPSDAQRRDRSNSTATGRFPVPVEVV